MQCELDVSKVKNGSFLYRDDNGKIISVTKEELLKDVNKEVDNLKLRNEQLENEMKCLKENFKSQNEKMAKFLSVIGGVK